MFLSIIIPALNEEKTLLTTLLPLQELRERGVEVIVVDGGSEDETLAVSAPYVDNVLTSKRGRACQMNTGAEVAQGGILLFLHADTQLPERCDELLRAFELGDTFWGRFNIQLSGRRLVFRVIETMMNWRTCLTGIVTGDHAMFISKKLFAVSGGFPDIDLMEDIEISKRLKRFKQPVCCASSVISSSRRWEQNGVLSTVLLMWSLRWQYFFNKSPATLALKYKNSRER